MTNNYKKRNPNKAYEEPNTPNYFATPQARVSVTYNTVVGYF
jgi:hypothetical protein